MTFISYAENGEDVLLHRALSSIRDGFYIDLGAGDPVENSVTKAFYDLGWSGINIEPLTTQFEHLAKERPRDINIQAVCLDVPGEVTFTVVENYEELSTVRPDGVDFGPDTNIREEPVRALTLASLCDLFVQQPIHFLKIDVEGAELQVLRGANFDQFRPWIVVVELEWSGRVHPDADEVHKFFADANYEFAFFDGINAYFVAQEHVSELGTSLSYPPCSRDLFVRSSDGPRRVLATIAEELGAGSSSDLNETLARVHQLKVDRIDFELKSIASQEALAEIEVQLGEKDKLLEKVTDEKDAHIAKLRQEAALTWQRSFERERYVSWQSAEIARMTREIESYRGSSSWRLTLPLRVLRHPSRYKNRILKRS